MDHLQHQVKHNALEVKQAKYQFKVYRNYCHQNLYQN